jgi:hypothetical protein
VRPRPYIQPLTVDGFIFERSRVYISTLKSVIVKLLVEYLGPSKKIPDITSNQATVASFYILYNSFFTNNYTIRRYVMWAIDYAVQLHSGLIKLHTDYHICQEYIDTTKTRYMLRETCKKWYIL